MDKISYGKWGGWIAPVGVLLSLFSLITAQPGFLSIDCGGKINQTGENNIRWVTDANYIDVGNTTEVGDAYDHSEGSYLDNLRFFPKPLNKSCYQLSVTPNVSYLLRLCFMLGNYSGSEQLPSFAFSIETLGMLAMGNVTILNRYRPVYNETILVSSGTVLYICLIRTSELHDPFISAIELRTLQQGMYTEAKPGTMLMLARRRDVGRSLMLRYPEDKFDRIWENELYLVGSNSNSNNNVLFISSEEPISTNNTKELPPPAVMQTAGVSKDTELSFTVGSTAGHKLLLLLYFAEIQKLHCRSFSVKINGESRSEAITSLSNYSTLERRFISNQTDNFYFDLVNTINATSGPIINAFETYKIVDTQPATYAQDLKALEAIKSSFGLKDWISDPCFLIHWNGIISENSTSVNSTSVKRISEIDLSGKNLTGLVSHDIGQLTALTKVIYQFVLKLAGRLTIII